MVSNASQMRPGAHMEFTDRFFGRGVPRPGGLPVANSRLADAPTYRVLFPATPALNADEFTLALRGLGEELAAATVEVQAVPSAGTLGLVGWGRHVVKLVVYEKPLPVEDVERCVVPALYETDIKEAAFRHTAHVQLFYAGYESDVLEQYVALTAVAAALARFGANAVLNEVGHTSVPATDLLPHEEDEGDTLRAYRKFPLPYLFAGFVKIEVEDEPGVWMRTHGCRAFGLPDLAFHADGHHQSTAVFGIFSNVLAYLRESGKSFVPGDTMGLGDGLFFRMREKTEAEWFLESPGELFVAERVSEAEALA